MIKILQNFGVVLSKHQETCRIFGKFFYMDIMHEFSSDEIDLEST